jgi:hypothetical protein
MLTAMHGHKVANPHSRFFASMLSGNAAVNRFVRYRAAVEAEFGAFDADSLNRFTETTVADQLTERRLIDSETIAGSWIIGFKIRHSGPFEKALYDAMEIRLSEMWLAIEPSYAATVLIPWQSDRKGTIEQNKLRARVSMLIGELKRSRLKARAAFTAREKILPKVLETVVSQRDYNLADFTADPKLQSNPLMLWSRIGLALQHLYLSEFYHGDKRALRKISIGTLHETRNPRT